MKKIKLLILPAFISLTFAWPQVIYGMEMQLNEGANNPISSASNSLTFAKPQVIRSSEMQLDTGANNPTEVNPYFESMLKDDREIVYTARYHCSEKEKAKIRETIKQSEEQDKERATHSLLKTQAHKKMDDALEGDPYFESILRDDREIVYTARYHCSEKERSTVTTTTSSTNISPARLQAEVEEEADAVLIRRTPTLTETLNREAIKAAVIGVGYIFVMTILAVNVEARR